MLVVVPLFVFFQMHFALPSLCTVHLFTCVFIVNIQGEGTTHDLYDHFGKLFIVALCH